MKRIIQNSVNNLHFFSFSPTKNRYLTSSFSFVSLLSLFCTKMSIARVRQLVAASGIPNALSYPRLTTPLPPTKTQKIAASALSLLNPNARVLAITLVKSGQHQRPHIRGTLATIGLRRLHQTVYQKNIPSVRGKLSTVRHLVTFKTID